MSNLKERPFNSKLFGWWILANAVGMAFVALALQGGGAYRLALVPLGITQGLALRPYVGNAVKWVLATLLGLVVGLVAAMAIVMVIVFSAGDVVLGPVAFALFILGVYGVAAALVGAAVGLFQRLLCLSGVRKAGQWTLVCTVGWALASATWIGASFLFAGPWTGDLTRLIELGPIISFAAGAVGGIVLGAITGRLLVSLKGIEGSPEAMSGEESGDATTHAL